MYFHGGGWVLGNQQTHDRLIREIVNGTQAAVVSVNYAPSPEAKYLAAIEQAYAATKYVAEYGDTLNLDSRRLAVAGDRGEREHGCGGHAVSEGARGPTIDYQELSYPVTDAALDTPSY